MSDRGDAAAKRVGDPADSDATLPASPRMTTTAALGWLAAVGGVALLLGRPGWVEVVTDGLRTQTLSGRGSDVAPAASAAGMVALAGAAACTIAGPRIRRLVLGMLTAVAALGAWSAAGVVLDPFGSAVGLVADGTGVTAASVRSADVSARLTPWAWLGTAVSLVLVATALFYLVTVGRWPSPARRTERFDRGDARSAPGSSRGNSEGRTPTQASPGKPSGGDQNAAEDWDALTRGEDPTAP